MRVFEHREFGPATLCDERQTIRDVICEPEFETLRKLKMDCRVIAPAGDASVPKHKHRAGSLVANSQTQRWSWSIEQPKSSEDARTSRIYVNPSNW